MKKFKRYQEGGEVSAEKDRSIGIKDVLGTVSPAFGMATGRGFFGKNDAGILPAVAREFRKRNAKDGRPMSVSIEIEEEGPEMEDDSEDMRGGGSVMRYAKGGMTGGRDGCAIRGKTKGRMC